MHPKIHYIEDVWRVLGMGSDFEKSIKVVLKEPLTDELALEVARYVQRDYLVKHRPNEHTANIFLVGPHA